MTVVAAFAQTSKSIKLPPCDWRDSLCDRNHLLKHCPQFIKKGEKERVAHLTSVKRCFNCFRKGHMSADCTSKALCEKCRKKHNTLLHGAWTSAAARAEAVLAASGNAKISHHTLPIWLSKSKNHSYSLPTNAIHDPGSSCSLLSQRMAEKLELKGKARPNALKVVGHVEAQKIPSAIDVEIFIKDKDRNEIGSLTACLLYTSPSPRDRG